MAKPPKSSFLHQGQEFIIFSYGCLDLSANLLIGNVSLQEIFSDLRYHLISRACILFSNSAVKVHDSQANRNTEMTRERISFTFDLGDMLLFL